MCHLSQGKIPMDVSGISGFVAHSFYLLYSLMYNLADGKSKVIKEYNITG